MFSSHRLDDVFVKSSFGSSLPPLIVSMGADDNADSAWAALTGSFQQMKARPVGEFNVAKQQIEILLLAKFFCLLHCMGHFHLVPISAEHS